MGIWTAACVALGLAAGGCTVPNPLYCETSQDCEVGVCTEYHACVDLDASTDAAGGQDASSCDERIAFLSGRDGVLQIYSMRPDGSDQVNLTMSSVNVTFFSGGKIVWSPSGDRIAFVQPTGASMFAIWVMNADGSSARAITSGQFDDQPAWSPDGTRIAFKRRMSLTSGPSNIWIVDVTGGAPQPVTTLTAGYNVLPSWSPDGSRIAFTSNRVSDYEVYTISPSGTNEVAVTTNTYDDGGSSSSSASDSPQWSPDGSLLLFSSRPNGNQDISVSGSDGSNPRNLTLTSAADIRPAWFPDGSKIVFMRTNDVNASAYDLWVMNADGTGQVPLDTMSTDDSYPSLSSDGTRLTWETNRDGNREVYSANSNGTGARRLTNTTAEDTIPAWRPCR